MRGLAGARLLKCEFEIDLKWCPNRGGELKTRAAILEAPVIECTLTHSGLQVWDPPQAPVRTRQLAHAA